MNVEITFKLKGDETPEQIQALFHIISDSIEQSAAKRTYHLSEKGKQNLQKNIRKAQASRQKKAEPTTPEEKHHAEEIYRIQQQNAANARLKRWAKTHPGEPINLETNTNTNTDQQILIPSAKPRGRPHNPNPKKSSKPKKTLKPFPKRERPAEKSDAEIYPDICRLTDKNFTVAYISEVVGVVPNRVSKLIQRYETEKAQKDAKEYTNESLKLYNPATHTKVIENGVVKFILKKPVNTATTN